MQKARLVRKAGLEPIKKRVNWSSIDESKESLHIKIRERPQVPLYKAGKEGRKEERKYSHLQELNITRKDKYY